MEKTLEKISKYFSGDKEMQKLGQRLCHKFRINYYAIVNARGFRIIMAGLKTPGRIIVLYNTVGYSLERGACSPNTTTLTAFGYPTEMKESTRFEIKFNKHDTNCTHQLSS